MGSRLYHFHLGYSLMRYIIEIRVVEPIHTVLDFSVINDAQNHDICICLLALITSTPPGPRIISLWCQHHELKERS